MGPDDRHPPPARHVVVLGAGFGGLTVARRLARRARDADLHVTIVDRNNYHTFQPLLYQVATAGLKPQDVGHAVRAVFGLRGDGAPSRVSFRMGEVVDVELEARRVVLADGGRIGYDELVIAAGATTADYGIPGVAEHAFPLKSIEHSLAIRNHVLRQFEKAGRDGRTGADARLTFVIAGAGPTGVELAGAMAELVDGPLRRDHPDLDLERVRIVLAEMQDRPLPPYSGSSQRYAAQELRRRGVELKLGVAIERVEPAAVVFADGERIPTSTLVWTAGVRAAPLADRLGAAQTGGGRIEVGRDLRLPGHGEVWVIGDIAGARDRDGELYPQLAPVAIQQGKHVARELLRRRAGRTPRPFHYLDKGTMATIGRNAAVTELPFGIRLTGFVAWIAWLGLHLLYLVGFRNRVAVLLSWIYNYVTYDRSARLILDDV